MKECSGIIVPVISFILSILCIFSGCTAPEQPGSNITITPEGKGSSTETMPSETLEETLAPAGPVQPERTTRMEPVMVITTKIGSGSGTILLDETCSLTIREYKEYPFSDMGYDFLYEGDKFQVSIRSEKPVIVYVVGYMDAIRIQASDNIPHYDEGVGKLQWGNVQPVFFWERVSDRIGTFTITDVGRYSFVIDPRWMTYDDNWKTKRPFTYELRITKL